MLVTFIVINVLGWLIMYLLIVSDISGQDLLFAAIVAFVFICMLASIVHEKEKEKGNEDHNRKWPS